MATGSPMPNPWNSADATAEAEPEAPERSEEPAPAAPSDGENGRIKASPVARRMARELGLELGKPLFLHSRDAHPRFAEILKHHQVKTAVAHCFTGEREELKACLDLGLYVGITGWICDERRGKHLLQLVRDIPADRLLLETDSGVVQAWRAKPRAAG